jgi:hypothetical protein
VTQIIPFSENFSVLPHLVKQVMNLPFLTFNQFLHVGASHLIVVAQYLDVQLIGIITYNLHYLVPSRKHQHAAHLLQYT